MGNFPHHMGLFNSTFSLTDFLHAQIFIPEIGN